MDKLSYSILLSFTLFFNFIKLTVPDLHSALAVCVKVFSLLGSHTAKVVPTMLGTDSFETASNAAIPELFACCF